MVGQLLASGIKADVSVLVAMVFTDFATIFGQHVIELLMISLKNNVCRVFMSSTK